MTRDRDIRRALRARLEKDHGHESDTLVLDELSLCQGSARVDMAVVNGSLHGYEIKSDRDTLERLAGQAEVYGRSLDTVTIVLGNKHAEGIAGLVPSWWGILEAANQEGQVVLTERRVAGRNPSVDKLSLAQLLWRDELLEILTEHGLAKGVASKSKPYLWARLAGSFDEEPLGEIVRRTLKSRSEWRVDARRA